MIPPVRRQAGYQALRACRTGVPDKPGHGARRRRAAGRTLVHNGAALESLVQRSLLWVRAWSRLVMGCLRLAPGRAGIADEGSVL